LENLYGLIKLRLESNLSLLEDKPEETIETTINALWNKAHGTSMSAEKASNASLPALSDQQKAILLQLIERRLNGEPLAHLTGRQNFMGIELLCDKRALIPRKETEILGKTAIEICRYLTLKKSIINVFDICCGSGNLGLAIASQHENTIIYASDLSHEAVELTIENTSFLNLSHRVKVFQSDLFSNFDSSDYWGKVDLIVCNPPYISTSKVSKMTSEIANNEPSMAFDGGMIGLKVIQRLIQESPKFLSEGGWLIFEVGVGQGDFVLQICNKSNHYNSVTSETDDTGNIRVIVAHYKKSKI